MLNTFTIPIVPQDDEERLEKLYSYNLLDSSDEVSFSHITPIAAQMFKVPIALVSLVDKDRVWFKGNEGMGDAKEIARGVSLCSLAILKDDVTVFENTKDEPCLYANPLVAGSFGLRFYAAAPLVTPDGYRIGAVCVADKQPRKFNDEDKRILEGLASLVMEEIETRKLQVEL
ncbi:GAF domain-containing protein [Pontibacter harenae]|uniref:GAF domain-containing protein n=1 Tax=Pontibacter harenae TaxID=2894083 RepID=UPI001E6547DB|nr:GAF domain-containing protein [Pontibacter harenae]MCC9166363.1 GAF domain-containing protein [Pontibacter harenae]